MHEAGERADESRSGGTFIAENQQLKTDNDKAAALDGLFQMVAAGGPMRHPPYASARPPFGRGNGGTHDVRGNGGAGGGAVVTG